MAHKTEEKDADFSIVAEPPPTTGDVRCEQCSAASSASSKAVNEDDVLRSSSATNRRTFRRLDAVDPGRKHAEEPEKRAVNRCLTCRRKVGLTGFRCRCGELFCADHRYSDRHDCSYDYKSAAREAIARENPVVRAPKVIKI